MKRGDVVVIAEGKPRPAVIVQSDQLATPVDVLLCPFTTHLIDAPLYRPHVEPDQANGLTIPSQLMVDKIAPAKRDRIGKVIGRLSSTDIANLDVSLTVVLELANG